MTTRDSNSNVRLKAFMGKNIAVEPSSSSIGALGGYYEEALDSSTHTNKRLVPRVTCSGIRG